MKTGLEAISGYKLSRTSKTGKRRKTRPSLWGKKERSMVAIDGERWPDDNEI